MFARMTVRLIIVFFIFIFGSALINTSDKAEASAVDLNGYLEKGRVYIEQGDYKAGVQSLAKAVQESATNEQKREYRQKSLDIIRELTDTLFDSENEKDIGNVMDIVDTAFGFEFYKNSEMLYNQKGSVYRKKGDIDKAIKEYNNALKIDANYSPSRFNLALCYFKMRKFKESYSELNKIPDSSSLYETAQEKKELLLKNFSHLIVK